MTITLTTDQVKKIAALQSCKDQILEQMKRREDRIQNFEFEASDCCLSNWAAETQLRKIEAEMDLVSAGEVWDFPAIFDSEGKVVNARNIKTKFGRSWAIVGEDGKFSQFLPDYHPNTITSRQKANLRKKGFSIGWVKKPARVELRGGSFAGSPTFPIIVEK